MVFVYFKMGQMRALNVETINFICLSYLVEMSAFKMFLLKQMLLLCIC